jgi:tRNA(Ile)-lysidine synthase TilS/MesJ
MGAMDWSRPLQPGLQLVRPLLDFSRVDTLAACELTGMEVRHPEIYQGLDLIQEPYRCPCGRALARQTPLSTVDSSIG